MAQAQELPIEANVFQGFSSTARSAPASPLVVHLPSGVGWSADIALQRQQLKETLSLDGAAFLVGDRATVAHGTRHQFEALRGEIVVSILPRRTGSDMLELDISITTRKDAMAVTTSICVSARAGSTFVLGGNSHSLPNGWATADAPFFVAITPLARFSTPAVWPIGGDVMPPKELSRVQPRFPPDAKREGRTGVVVFDVVVDTSGAIASVEVARHADPDLEQAALEAVKQWRYQPATRNGAPVPVWLSITMRFPRSPAPTPTEVPAA
jgi:TonB family protein